MTRSPARRTPRGRAPVPATRRDYCTYFDHRYLAQGLALYRSLEEHALPFRLFVLALTPECESTLRELNLEHAVVVPIVELERFDPELLAVKGTRSAAEYYFTSTAPFIRFVIERDASVELLTYLDADLAFFSSPEPIFAELEGHAIGIVAHRFPKRLREHERYGRFNVAWVSFRRNEAGLACLEWWRERCLEWCFDREEDGKFADQKYLDSWPERFRGVRVIAHPGADLALWNLESHRLSGGPAGLLVDDQPLIFFHAHRFELEPGRGYDAHPEEFGVDPGAVVTAAVFAPYARRLGSALGELAALRTLPSTRAEPGAVGATVREVDGAARLREILKRDAEIAAHKDEIGELRSHLAGSEADRAARLDEILRRGERIAELEGSLAEARAKSLELDEARRAAEAEAGLRLEVVQRLDAALREAEADRAERLALAERLGSELNAETARRAALEERTATLFDELAQRSREIAALGAELADLRDERLRLHGELGAARERSIALRQKLDEVEADGRARLAVIESLGAELAAMRASWSWRLSRPLRLLSGPLRRR